MSHTTLAPAPGLAGPRRPVPWVSALATAVASVGWAFVGMTAVAALGLHLLGADTQGSLAPMTAAVVTMAVGGKVSPSGDLSVFGVSGAGATAAVDIIPLGVGLAGALLLAWIFLRSLRQAGLRIGWGELAARAVMLVVLFAAALWGLAWAGHDTISINGATLGSGGGGSGGILGSVPGLGDLGNLDPGLLGGLNDLVKTRTSVGFHVETGPTLASGVLWAVAVLAIALLASRHTPLPHGWEALHRQVRPAVSALCAALLLTVAAGLLVSVYAAVTDDHPGRIIGTALVGGVNGVWLGAALGLFVPWHGRATGPLAQLVPHPLDRLIGAGSERPVTVSRLAQLDGRVWLLVVAAALMILTAGVLAAARTPVAGASPWRYTALCALRLGLATAVGLGAAVWLTGFSVNADLSVFGFDAVGAGVDLHASLAAAVGLGAAWGAAAGAVGALLARATGAAGSRASPLASATRGVAG
ncbi:streptophobe family protein [Streptomyces humicola]|uniref:streptophobe family protein n=1 Tax=Streptomyces humicola TaxID=2953240 RepID=UPI0027E32CDE|nr:streptophobe family protein [Streptomyces humicola]